MKKIDLTAVPVRRGASYPPPFDAPCQARERQRLGDVHGLSQFGVSLLTLPPGAWSSQRHWHSGEDEFVWVVEGEVTLVTDDGEETLRSGDCAGFRAGEANGHHLINRSAHDAKVLEIGTRGATDRVIYSDADMVAEPEDEFFRHRDGSPYPTI